MHLDTANPLDDRDSSPAAYQLLTYQSVQRDAYAKQQGALAKLMVQGMML